MAANPTHEKKRASMPGNFDMFFQSKTVTAQVATKAQRIDMSFTFLICNTSPQSRRGRKENDYFSFC